MLTAADLATMRTVQAGAMLDTCTLRVWAPTVDAWGSEVAGWTQRTGVPLRAGRHRHTPERAPPRRWHHLHLAGSIAPGLADGGHSPPRIASSSPTATARRSIRR